MVDGVAEKSVSTYIYNTPKKKNSQQLFVTIYKNSIEFTETVVYNDQGRKCKCLQK